MADSKRGPHGVAGEESKKQTGQHSAGEAMDEPSRRRAGIRLTEEERLTPSELKQRFATNLDRLLGVVGLNRKNTAQEVGIPYKLMQRLASAGVSRTDERNLESLTKIATFFALSRIDDLWRADFLRLVLTTHVGNDFVEKFRDHLRAEWERRLAAARAIDQEEMTLLCRALGVEEAARPSLTGPIADKLLAILSSARGPTFQRVIDDYYELVRQHVSDPDDERGAGRSAARA